ncbi:hypothetical protein [Streptomyces avermitilis]|uniref:hypothetical protein n=1 Tax=Streptomyces avermitilis TaxID=33903 RepID=UPI00371610BB
MPASEGPRQKPRQLTQLGDVHDFLDEVRLRPGMWLRGSSLQHLESMLIGYRVALGVHGIPEDFDFWSPGQGPFAEWLWQRLGHKYPSALGWAVEIEREAEATNESAVELFFSLLDEFRAERSEAKG